MSESPHIVDVDEANFNDQVVENSRRVPVVVDFWADWCGPCKNLMPILAKLADEYAGGFILARVNTDEQQRLAQHFGVRSLPTVMIVRDGQIVDQFTGAQPEGQVRAILERHATPAVVAGNNEVQTALAAFAAGDLETARSTLEQAHAADPEDVEACVALARVTAAGGDAAAAERLLGNVPSNRADDPAVRAARAELQFARRLADAPAPEELNRRIAADAGDSEAAYYLALHQLARGDREGALEALFVLTRRDRAYGDDVARKTLVEIFDLLGGDDPLVKSYRRRLFTLMY